MPSRSTLLRCVLLVRLSCCMQPESFNCVCRCDALLHTRASRVNCASMCPARCSSHIACPVGSQRPQHRSGSPEAVAHFCGRLPHNREGHPRCNIFPSLKRALTFAGRLNHLTATGDPNPFILRFDHHPELFCFEGPPPTHISGNRGVMDF